MSIVKRIAYSRGMEEYLPLILFGADAHKPEESANTSLTQLPGGQIVKAL